MGLMGFVGLEEDQFLLALSGVGGVGATAGGGGGGGGGKRRKRCRSSSFSGSGIAVAGLSPSARKVRAGKDSKRMRCRSSSFGSAAAATGSSSSPPPPPPIATRVNKRDKRMPVRKSWVSVFLRKGLKIPGTPSEDRN